MKAPRVALLFLGLSVSAESIASIRCNSLLEWGDERTFAWRSEGSASQVQRFFPGVEERLGPGVQIAIARGPGVIRLLSDLSIDPPTGSLVQHVGVAGLLASFGAPLTGLGLKILGFDVPVPYEALLLAPPALAAITIGTRSYASSLDGFFERLRQRISLGKNYADSIEGELVLSDGQKVYYYFAVAERQTGPVLLGLRRFLPADQD